MKVCAVICWKATLRFSMLISSLPGANSRFPEHKIGVFVLFWPSGPPFSGIPSTKSRFLCFFVLRNPRFRAFRAQNWGFCAFLAFGTPVFRLFKHKIGIFVLGEVCSGGLLGLCYSGRAAQRVLLLLGSCCSGCGAVYLLAARRAKSSFLKVAASVKSSACMPAVMAPSTLAGLSSVKRHSEALSPNFWQSRS